MTRRQALESFSYVQGYSDSLQPLSGNVSTYAQGSANQFILGQGLTRPFAGYYSKGTNSGVQVATQLGNSWGGLQNYTNVTASGSLIKDALSSLYTIGAGTVMFEGVPVEIAGSTFALSSNSDINTTTDIITKIGHGLADGQAVLISAGTSLPTVAGTALSSTTSYFVKVLSSSTFTISYTYSAGLAGTPVVDFTSQGVGTITFSYGSDFRASTVLQSASVKVNNNWYSYSDQAGLGQPTAPNVSVPTTPGTGYTGLINGAIAFKLGAIRNRANAGTDLTSTGPIPVKSIASTTSAVVVPTNQTVKIQFPAAASGQTHWTVFATKQGFGGTGVLLRVGYRTSSSTSATWYWQISETTVAAATGRQLEFDFQDGDLYPEEAWLFDYQPPPGTHFLRLDNCGVVLGCYDGTVCAVSLPNFLESYNPFHLLYLAEPVVGVLHRQSDDYAYVAGRNSIYAIQYVGFRGDDLPSATITTISPDVGIAAQSNWTQCQSSLVAWIEGKGVVRMSAGISGQVEIDYEFGKQVSKIVSTFDSSTVVCFNPATQSVVVGCGDVSVSYCFESNVWSPPVYNSDAGITGNWLSGVNSRGELIASLSASSVYTAYSWDNNTSTTRIVAPTVSRWQSANVGARSNNIYEMEVGLRGSTNVEPIVCGIHTNLFRTNIRTVAMTATSNVVTASSAIFNDTFTGKQSAIFGAGIGSLTFTAATNDLLTFTSTAGMVTGQSITVTNSGGGLPSPLATSTTYYIIVISSTTIKLATTLKNALAGTPIDITTTGTGTQTAVINFLTGYLTYVSTTTCTLKTQSGTAINSAATVSGMFALVGQYFRAVPVYASTEEHLVNLRPAIQNARSFCTSVVQVTDAIDGAIFVSNILGTDSQSSVISTT